MVSASEAPRWSAIKIPITKGGEKEKMKKQIGLIIATIVLFSVFAPMMTSAQLADTPWPMFHHDLRHTGLSPYNGPQTADQKWNFTTGNLLSSPAIGVDGTIYVGSYDNKLYAINPDGTEKWHFIIGSWIGTSPAIASDGTIYVGSHDNKLYAINPDGTEKWHFTTGHRVESSPAIGSDGTIYVGSCDNKLYAINPDGTEKWHFITGDHIWSSPAIGSDGTIYVGSHDNKLYAINPDGTEKWHFITGHYIYSSPAIGSDGTIYVGSMDDKLYAINSDGTEKWHFITGHDVDSSPAIGADGTIYVGSMDNKFYAINSDGTEKWHFITGSNVHFSPAIGDDRTIYIGSNDCKLYAIGTYTQITSCDNDGKEKNQFEPGESVYVKGNGLEAETIYQIWIQSDPVSEGDLLTVTEDPSGFPEVITTNANGDFGPEPIWAIPSHAPPTYDKFDIVVDKLNDGGNTGKYNADSDGLDSATVVGFVAPVPEFPTMALPVVTILGLLFLISRRRRKR